MVNVGFSFTTMLGLLDLIAAVSYFILTIGSITDGVNQASSVLSLILKIYELLICPGALFLSGIILIFNGWRLDPILQFQQLLFHLVVGVAVAKEINNLTST
ncbi:MAG: Ycf66 family protein [Cyanobacteria bacterium J06623_7]